MDRWFNSVLATQGYGIEIAPELAPKQMVVEVVKDLKNRNLHPTDQPRLDATAGAEGFNSFTADILEALPILVANEKGSVADEEVLEKFEALKKRGNQFIKLHAYGMEVNRLKERLQSRYGDIDMVGLMAKPNTRNPKRAWDSSDPDVIKYKIMSGDPDFTPDPSWHHALHSYLKQNLENLATLIPKEMEGAVTSLCQRLSMVYL